MEFVPQEFASFMTQRLDARPEPVRILEVGGGAVSRVPHDDAQVTVLDCSPDALARNTGAVETLVGDAQVFEYGERRFDVAVFWNVLEHIAVPEAAVERAAQSLDDGGMIVVRGPDLGSLKAVITRFTPHWVHVLFYRWVLGIADAGTAGRPPCRVEHDGHADRVALIALFRRLGFTMQYEQRYVGDQVLELERFSRLAFRLYAGAAALVRLLTFSRYGTRETEFILVARKALRA
ncbi:class I SAM-dependent methyltransferase [Sphingomonas sp.]|uniref:class I SAM-dependent methyltransferase n=1 Tax=Sphingomonas sp. TaxID=28214 RepID=UPI0035BC18B4